MKELKITQSAAVAAHKAADPATQVVLEKLLGKENLTLNILDCATAQEAYEMACEQLGKKPRTLEQFIKHYEEEDEGKAKYALHRITTVIKAVKNGRKLDYDDTSKGKYSGWFDMREKNNRVPGSVFSFNGYDCDITGSGVGARLSSFTEKEAKRICELMLPDYQIWMTED